MTKTLTMSCLYDRLSQLGLNLDYVRNNGLPSWWNDSLNDKPLAVLEGAGYIADNLNLDLKSLLAVEEEIKFNPSPSTKFKRRSSQNNEQPHVGQALCSRLAELIAHGTEVNFTSLPTDVREIRTEILTDHTTVNLISLLDYCWSKGIVVGYFNRFPEKVQKFAGLIQLQFSCPVIILSSTHKYSAEFAFDLAHELGHLALGHLEQKTVLIDEKIESDSNGDYEENEANHFATQLLLGDCDNCLGDKQFYSHKHFIKHVNIKSEENPTVEIDSIILNNAWHNNNWGFAHKALEKLGFAVDGQQIINKYLADKLDWDKFNDESYEYLEKALGV
jgi:IrrE N-terminal-like domain